jgi:hypothetical protein
MRRRARVDNSMPAELRDPPADPLDFAGWMAWAERRRDWRWIHDADRAAVGFDDDRARWLRGIVDIWGGFPPPSPEAQAAQAEVWARDPWWSPPWWTESGGSGRRGSESRWHAC